MSKFNYILNDLAFDTLVMKCLYGEPTDEDVKECENQIELLKQENQALKEKINMLEDNRKYTYKIIGKAIEYIEKETIYNDYNEVYRGILDGRNANELLRILNGDLNE